MDIVYDVLFAAGIFLTYFFGAISGGIGLIVRPLLILGAGLPPQVAIGTARVASLGAQIFSLSQFYRYNKIDWKLAGVLAIPSTLGGLIGARLVTSLDEAVLTRLVGVLIILLGGILLCSRDVGIVDTPTTPSLLRKAAGFVMFWISSIIASITGGGGILASSALILIYKKTYITSAAIRRVASYGGACSASVLFLRSGLVNWKYTAMVLIAGGLGSYFGVSHGIKQGERWGRILVLVVVFLIGLRMLFF